MPENPLHITSKVASAAITANRFVVYGAAGIATMAGAGVAVDGVSRYAADAGAPVAVNEGGVSFVEAGEALADNALVMSGADGVAMLFVDGVAANFAVGQVTNQTSAAAAGEIIAVQLYATAQYAGSA